MNQCYKPVGSLVTWRRQIKRKVSDFISTILCVFLLYCLNEISFSHPNL